MHDDDAEQQRVITEPVNLQSRHDEADTLVAFRAKQAPEGNILIRSTTASSRDPSTRPLDG